MNELQKALLKVLINHESAMYFSMEDAVEMVKRMERVYEQVRETAGLRQFGIQEPKL